VTDPRARPLSEGDFDPDPLVQFRRWFEEARSAAIRAPHAVALATATREGRPSVRIVLAQSFDERGFVFYSGTASRKGRELGENPAAALLFHWDVFGRQVRIEGDVEPVAREDVAAYFASRPRGHQLSSWASPQSEVVEGRNWLEARVAEAAARFEGRDVELPAAWGGYRLTPSSYEFWQHREDRLHDRLRYRRDGDRWRLERLAP
jgi:pyridoxamine 5'-phosphate oxidase